MATQVKLVQAQDYKKQPRVHRKPKERWVMRSKPYEIRPIALHPVLRGETIDSAFIQCRVITDKVKSNLIGWHYEQHWFYVPLRSVTDPNFGTGISADQFKNLFLTTTTSAM